MYFNEIPPLPGWAAIRRRNWPPTCLTWVRSRTRSHRIRLKIFRPRSPSRAHCMLMERMKQRVQNAVSTPFGREFVQRGARSQPSYPTCSIVVTSRVSARELQSAIDGLLPRIANAGVEVIGVRAVAGSEQVSVARIQAGVSMIVAPASHDRFQLRELGLARASGDVVAFVDEVDGLASVWADQLRERLSAIPTGAEVRARPLPMSVIVPVHRQPALAEILDSLAASDLPRASWELIVVTDASDVATEAAASRHADFIIRLRRDVPFGPAYARNRGFEMAAGESVVFIDSDVRVRPDTLARFADALEAMPEVSAVFGSYDDAPAAPGFVSQYRNLLEHYCRQRHGGEASTFWAACGAIRSRVFADVGMYDEWRFRRPQIEDLELGRRIKDHGHRIVLRPDIQATHLKRWTLSGMLSTDLRDRGLTWSRSIATRGRRVRAEPCFRQSTDENAVLTALAMVLALAATKGTHVWMALGALVLVLGVVWNNRLQLQWFARRRGIPFAVATVPLDLARNLVSGLAVVLGMIAREVVGEGGPNVVVQAYSEVGLKTWPPVPARRR